MFKPFILILLLSLFSPHFADAASAVLSPASTSQTDEKELALLKTLPGKFCELRKLATRVSQIDLSYQEEPYVTHLKTAISKNLKLSLTSKNTLTPEAIESIQAMGLGNLAQLMIMQNVDNLLPKMLKDIHIPIALIECYATIKTPPFGYNGKVYGNYPGANYEEGPLLMRHKATPHSTVPVTAYSFVYTLLENLQLLHESLKDQSTFDQNKEHLSPKIVAMIEPDFVGAKKKVDGFYDLSKESLISNIRGCGEELRYQQQDFFKWANSPATTKDALLRVLERMAPAMSRLDPWESLAKEGLWSPAPYVHTPGALL